MFSKIVILDGYTDEPSGLGVPPYIGVYPRLVAGSIWCVDKSIEIKYWTIDQVRVSYSSFLEDSSNSDLIVFIVGAEVPGKYIGGKPVEYRELEYLVYLLRDKFKVLVGPAAHFGYGLGGGSIAIDRSVLKKLFDEIVYGDPELYFYELMKYGPEKTESWRVREDYSLADKAFIYGAKIIEQHPNYGWNLIVEIETFRGCPRWIVGGCSFCIEPRYGKPLMRGPESIVKEVEYLYRFGARHIRLGRQPDILVYGSREIGFREFPRPEPKVLERLFYGIRNNAPGLRIIHIDNVNPGTIVHNEKEAIEALKIIIKYHSPGDVAALGVESFDERVVRENNLKVYPDEALKAIRIINRYGSIRGWNGLPHLLPGINLLHGLPGETRETFRRNIEYLEKIKDEGLFVRRVNIRKVSVLENTSLWIRRDLVKKLLRRHEAIYRSYRRYVMVFFDKYMLSRIVPRNTILRYLFTEKKIGEFTIARLPGSYPITVKIRGDVKLRKIVDVRIESIAAKSVTGRLI
ncbi:MAG: radical SAM protein [Desulfurococcales archaeon ex4484_58]|nr:MAG: radical SAM protein [Desulfurococcales archaeon ex4484_58]